MCCILLYSVRSQFKIVILHLYNEYLNCCHPFPPKKINACEIIVGELNFALWVIRDWLKD